MNNKINIIFWSGTGSTEAMAELYTMEVIKVKTLNC